MNFWALTVAGEAARAAIGRQTARAAENVNNTSSTRRKESIAWTPWAGSKTPPPLKRSRKKELSDLGRNLATSASGTAAAHPAYRIRNLRLRAKRTSRVRPARSSLTRDH